MQSNDGGTAWIMYDGRAPIYGNDIAINAAINLTHTRGRHTYKMGVMREDELFSQARSGTFGGQFNFADDALHPNRTGYAWANAVLGQVARYTESMGRVPDDRRQKTGRGMSKTPGNPRPRSRWTSVCACTNGGRHSRRAANRPSSATSVSIRGVEPACVLSAGPRRHTRVGSESGRSGAAGDVHRLDGAGHRLQLHAGITADTPCAINGIVTQRDGNYLDGGGEGFIEPMPIQFDRESAWRGRQSEDGDSRRGWVVPRWDRRAFGQQGDANVAYRLNRTIYTDYDSYLNAGSAASPVPNTNGPVRTDNRRPNNLRFTSAIQREIGKNIVVDAAYVGMRSNYLARGTNINQILYLRRFDPAYKDPTVAATATNPGALPDAFLRPTLGYSDILRIETGGW